MQLRPIAVLRALPILLAAAMATDLARADTYSLTVVAYTQSSNFLGIDNLGNFTVNWNNSPVYTGPGSTCGSVANAPTCYQTFYSGAPASVFSTAAPALDFNVGSVTGCGVSLPAGFSVLGTLCNGGHFLVNAFYSDPSTSLRGIWGGPEPELLASYLSNGSIDGGFMNAFGDAVYIDGIHNTLVFADDLSTSPSAVPEPSALVLLGTGALAAVGAARRRFAR